MKLFGFKPIKRRTVSRKGWWFSGLMLGWLCFPGWGWCEPPTSPVPPPESLVSPPASLPPQAVSPPEIAAETLWLPLREVIQQYSESTGKRVRLSGRLQTEDKLFDRVYSANDSSWLEDFSRVEIFNEELGKKEIILLKSHPRPSPAQARTSPKRSRKKISRAGAPGVSGPAGAKQRRKSKFPNIFRPAQ